MIDFRPIEMSDKPLFDKALDGNDIASCDYSFATIICWRNHYQTQIAEVDGFVVCRFTDNDGQPSYSPPFGHGDKRAAVQAIIDDARERGATCRIGAVTKTFVAEIESYFGHELRAVFSRNQSEYIYRRESLATLSGAHLQAKRNHVNKFCRLYPNHTIRQLGSASAAECIALYNKWLQQVSGREADPEEMHDEQLSVEFALSHFEELGLKGIALYVDTEMIAFAYGEMLTADTFLTHAEKALNSFEGSYAMINKATANMLSDSVLYINREEDMGLEYLRRSKMSYNPAFLLEKGIIYIDEK